MDKHLLLTRYDPARAERGEMLKTEDVLEILSIPLLGIIPESEEVLRASNLGSPVTIANPLSGRRPRLCRRRQAAQRRDRDAHHSDRQAEPVRQAVRAEGRMNLFSFFNLFRRSRPRRSRATGCRSCSRTSAPSPAAPTSSRSCAKKSSP